jgi:RecA-family ATPase
MSGKGTEKSPGAKDPAADMDLDDIMPVDRLVIPPPRPLPVHRIIWDNALDEVPPMKWLIEGILPEGSLGVVYGDPGAGKTFVVLDWSFSIATGDDWWGHGTEPGDVIYVVGEGWTGIRDRAAAWKASRNMAGFDKTGVAFLGRAIRLLDPRDIEQFVKSSSTWRRSRSSSSSTPWRVTQ